MLSAERCLVRRPQLEQLSESDDEDDSMAALAAGGGRRGGGGGGGVAVASPFEPEREDDGSLKVCPSLPPSLPERNSLSFEKL